MEEAKHLQQRNHYNISQFRIDAWNRLKNAVDQLAQKSERSNSPAELVKQMPGIFAMLETVEMYWAFPGLLRLDMLRGYFDRKEYVALSNATAETVRDLVSRTYRIKPVHVTPKTGENGFPEEEAVNDKQKYFEVLIVDDIPEHEVMEFRRNIHEISGEQEDFKYDIVVAHTFQDALLALLFNYNIQSVVIRYGFPYKSRNNLSAIKPFVQETLKIRPADFSEAEIGPALAEVVRTYRPELDLYFVTDRSLNDISADIYAMFRRIFYRQEDVQELHLSIRKGIEERYETPFFTALMKYSTQPTGVFHAMPISRGNSIFKSQWIKDMGDFYGRNIFLAETSATTGGLDSLLQPVGPLKKAQELASRAFGSKHTFFVTNGTSTANKIVLQALVQPNDVVLVDRDCHKSHHYGLVLQGAYPVYLDSFAIEKYSMYGAVPLKQIKNILLQFKAEGRLDKVKMLVLTNCTFDGIVYNVERVMEEVLAIKPDMIFLWDEAWFAFARFKNTYRNRTAMSVADAMSVRYRSEEYRSTYRKHIVGLKEGELPLMPDPDQVKIRAYSTQSTHKTLTSLRQGSMVHVHDELFRRQVEDSFHEAYMTHISTSPSYQILASLDAGRRQVELEGRELVENSIERAMNLRVKVANDRLLRKYFDILTSEDVIPKKYRKSGFKRYYSAKDGWTEIQQSWQEDEFVLDPTKINLYIGRTGIDGDTFKREYLMDQFGIQVNKTTRNTVLFMTNIGTTRSSVAFLVSVLTKIARQIEEQASAMNPEEEMLHQKQIVNLTENLPPLPDFSHFHRAFRPNPTTPEGFIRDAFFKAYSADNCRHLPMEQVEEAIDRGEEVVSASFVIPYPPGFPVLVPGQVITQDILDFMKALDVKEIHSFRPELGFRVFTEAILEEAVAANEQQTTIIHN